ncbi:GNAT family N-acetyltransferase [Paenibacillus sp. OAS669]|uniref:GNAT family N-acetyltransferase n=1 Tax=Paenibacillus sp. OAS669 TaxID=2663821 RepID=UPI00178BC8E4|nr:GNAT family N-acetyltransferase [Paenibacillus sp. OAS669]MBE1442892.1 GNAT superfamily N-acetyltransferase [Paenibacillus sp. OAS669]
MNVNTAQQFVLNNFEEKLKAFTQAVNGKLTEEEDFVIANTEIPTDTFNVLLPKSPNIQNAAKLAHGIENFRLKAYPFCTWMDAAYLSNEWINLLREYDLQEAERNVTMKLDNTLHVSGRMAHQLTITPVRNNEELMNYKEVFMSLFEGTSEKDALKAYFDNFSHEALGSKIQMFIGCVGENTVSTGLLIEANDSYGIYDVMTREGYRGRGYGSEMFQFLLNQTTDKHKPVVLQASEDGKNIYKRFGFMEIGEMIVFQ